MTVDFQHPTSAQLLIATGLILLVVVTVIDIVREPRFWIRWPLLSVPIFVLMLGLFPQPAFQWAKVLEIAAGVLALALVLMSRTYFHDWLWRRAHGDD